MTVITFAPSGRSYEAADGRTILAFSEEAGGYSLHELSRSGDSGCYLGAVPSWPAAIVAARAYLRAISEGRA